MKELEKFGKLRMPLEPLPPANGVEDEAYKARLAKYKELLDEFHALAKLRQDAESFKPSIACSIIPLIGDKIKEQSPEGRALMEYTKRFPRYAQDRVLYIARNERFLETIDMVRAKIKRMNEECERLAKPITPPMPRMPLRKNFASQDEYNAAFDKFNDDFEKWDAEFGEAHDNAHSAWLALFNAKYDEESKFREIDDEAEAAFQKAAKMTIAGKR